MLVCTKNKGILSVNKKYIYIKMELLNSNLNINPKITKPNKVALCFIISYKHVLNQEAVWKKWIEPNKNWINVYVHYKHINHIKSPWLRSHTIPPNYISETSYFHVVPAYISLLSFAKHHDSLNQWFCMLTDSCMPIISPEHFKERFQQYGSKSIMSIKGADWNPDFHGRANLKRLPPNLHIMHDPWFTLTLSHVNQIIQFIFNPTTRTIYSTVCAGGLANESVFAIMLGVTIADLESHQSRQLLQTNKNLMNMSTTIVDWSRRPSSTSPHLFTMEDNPYINQQVIQGLLQKNPLAMFLRKVSPEFVL